MILLPRMDDGVAREVLKTFEVLSPKDRLPVAEIAAAMPLKGRDEQLRFSFRGDGRIPAEMLSKVRHAVVDAARQFGYPEPIPTSSVSDFDSNAGAAMREHLDLTLNEAANPAVWTYLTCCWLLDVAVWRWDSPSQKKIAENRFLGNLNRNSFRRIWWAAEMLNTPTEGLPSIAPNELTQDNLLQIFERPAVISNKTLARAIVIELIEARENRPEGVTAEDLLRDLMKRLRRLSAFVLISAYDLAEAKSLIRGVLSEAASGLATTADSKEL